VSAPSVGNFPIRLSTWQVGRILDLVHRGHPAAHPVAPQVTLPAGQ